MMRMTKMKIGLSPVEEVGYPMLEEVEGTANTLAKNDNGTKTHPEGIRGR